MRNSTPNSAPDLNLAFDVGHSSIGWAVLQKAETPHLLGCGSVIFPADDCLASQRRAFRRQRRHIRATRLRIARVKAHLNYLGVLTKEQLDSVENSSPWWLAARVLKSNGGRTLTWPELWDVLRWYSHNRGYDGNKVWSRQEEDAAVEKEDTEKVQNAFSLLKKYGTETMAETWCEICELDPLGPKSSCALPGNVRPKAQNAAFPREIVVAEVEKILRAHIGKLLAVDETLLDTLLRDWRKTGSDAFKLPSRYHGGLLFGQLIPRFDNRIIARCPIAFERVYQETLAEENDEAFAKKKAERLAKVPSANCREFFRYRWAMQLANIQVVAGNGGEPSRLTAAQRQALDRQGTVAGGFTKGEFKKAVRALTDGAQDNLDQMLMHPEAERALVVDPVTRKLADKAASPYFDVLPAAFQKRLTGMLRRGKPVSFSIVRGWMEDPKPFDATMTGEIEAANTRKTKKASPLTREDVLERVLRVEPLSGRAPHSREIMAEVVDFVLNTQKHPAEKDGPLYRSDAIRAAQLQRRIAEQTNNHLVRHRLLLLDRLHRDLIESYAGADRARIEKITIEVNRDLREMSGKTNKEIEQDIGRRLGNFKAVSEKLEKDLTGRDIPITAGLIRKARIAHDLGWTCPYTGKAFDVFDLASRRVDKDHIVPRSERMSDSLDSLVITFAEINRMKGKRTALRFIEECGGQAVEGLSQVSIKPLARYEKDIAALETYKGHDDDKRRKRNRKRLLQLRDYVEKEFTPRDLTQTSQLVRLGAQTLERHYQGSETKPVITSLPGSVTGAVRKSWDLIGCLEAANPNVRDSATGEIRTKTEIRDITHLHHALDACVLAFASLFLPGQGRDGSAWQLLVKRRLNVDEQRKARDLFGSYVQFNQDGQLQLIDLPNPLKAQIRQRLAECRVVQHVPKEMDGLRAELNAWRVVGHTAEGDQLHLRQRIRQPDGTRPEKTRKERPGKLVGLRPGKLHDLKAALIIADNYGLALDPEPTVIPFHKVWVRLRELRQQNGGKPVRVLRNGMLISIARGRFSGIWRIFSLKNAAAGILLDLGRPDVTRLRNKTEGHKINVQLSTLLRDGATPLQTGLCGIQNAGTLLGTC